MFFSHERRGRRGKPPFFQTHLPPASSEQTMQRTNTPSCGISIKGDMSFVGPRPLISSEMRAHRLRLEYRGVLSARAHRLGPDQRRDSISLLRKMKLDKEYCDNWSLKLDLIILLRSVGAVVKQEGFHEGTYHRR